ncbi:hypothetical protein ACFPRL_24740 [Pseudoclavibacter helvolus]
MGSYAGGKRSGCDERGADHEHFTPHDRWCDGRHEIAAVPRAVLRFRATRSR